MNLDYYITLSRAFIEETYQRAKSMPSAKSTKCTKLANAEKNPKKRAGIYKKCMGDVDDPTNVYGEIDRGSSPFK